MKKLIYVFLFTFTFLFIYNSYSQDNKYKYSQGTYYADLKTSVSCDEPDVKINVVGMLIYGTKESEYMIGIGLEETKEYIFDIINYTISVDTEEETLKYMPASDHIAIDLTAFAFIVPADDLLKYSGSKKVILNVVLIKGGDNGNKEIPFKIDLKPEETKVYSDFYNLGLKNK